MTENITTWRGDEETILASDIWRAAKNLTPMSAEDELEAWRKTVRTLNGLCMMADGLVLDPLSLALVDAKVRAEEELERAKDRAEMGEPGKLHPRERERLLRLLRHSDALSNARVVLLKSGENYAEDAERLGEMLAEVDEQFLRYRRECGLAVEEGPIGWEDRR